MNIDVGHVIAGKYELVRLIGKGAMGEVWLATHNSLGGEFAIKLVEPTEDAEAETAAGRFQLEAQIAAKLSRKTRHIVSVSDHGEEDGLAYLVMELLEGESLEGRSKRAGPLPLPEVAAILTQVARALSLAHEEHIFHRDLKPANVWLGKDEDGRLLVKLLDFGIARSQKPFRTRSPFATSKDMVLGTPSYMSPEQARGLDTLDYRCDLWALAVVAYEALTQTIPFEGETVEDIFLSICTFRVVPVLSRRADLPPAIDAFFARAFAPKLEERYANAAELTENFERFVTPEDLEVALGLPFAPGRLGEGRGSSPRLSPSFRSHPELQSRPGSEPRIAPSPSRPALEPDAGPGGDSMSVKIGRSGRPRRAGGWIVAVAAAVALVGAGLLILVGFRGRNNATIGTAPEPIPTASVAEVAPPIVTIPTGAASPPLGSIRAEITPPPTKTSVPAVRSQPSSAHAGAANITPSNPLTAPPPHPPPPPSHPTPPPAKSINKDDVF